MKLFITIFIIILSYPKLYANSETDSLIKVLKKELGQKAKYDSEKDNRILKIKNNLYTSNGRSAIEIYNTKSLLLNEYISYKRDSALDISNDMINIARKIDNHQLVNESLLKHAKILITCGIFKEAYDCLQLVDISREKNDLKYKYYHLQTWLNWAMQTSINDNLYSKTYIKKEMAFRDSSYKYANPDNYDLELNGKFSEQQRIQSDINYNNYISQIKQLYANNPEKAASLAYMFSGLFTDNRSLNLLLLASIIDVRNSTKETAAIIKVGERLYENGKIDDAFYFLREAMDDAEFYGSKLHKIEISSILSKVSEDVKIRTQRQIMTIIVIALILIFILSIVIYSRTKLKSLYQKISLQNTQLNQTLLALEKSQNENSWILKVLAHDLRGTITGSIGFNEILRNNKNLSQDEIMMIDLLEETSQDPLNTISDLLNIKANNNILKKSEIDIKKMLIETAILFQQKAEEKNS